MREQQEAAEYEAWFQREVQRGINDANAGNVVSNEEVEAEAAAWRAGLGLPDTSTDRRS